MDDYYKSPQDVPVDEKGVKDFECLEALRIEDFNSDLNRIFKGEKGQKSQPLVITNKGHVYVSFESGKTLSQEAYTWPFCSCYHWVTFFNTYIFIRLR